MRKEHTKENASKHHDRMPEEWQNLCMEKNLKQEWAINPNMKIFENLS